MEDLFAEFNKACARLSVDEDSLELSKKILDRCGVLSAETLSSPQVQSITGSTFSHLQHTTSAEWISLTYAVGRRLKMPRG